MKKIFAIIICLSIISMAGCTDRNDPAVLQKNAAEFAGNGEFVAKFKNGKEARRYYIENGDHIDHWMYVVVDSEGVPETETITINSTVNSGKTTTNSVQVIVNGETVYTNKE